MKPFTLGFDLASVAQAEIPAGNAGKVIWADYLGIYGLCVVNRSRPWPANTCMPI